jgi:hypothetical protein
MRHRVALTFLSLPLCRAPVDQSFVLVLGVVVGFFEDEHDDEDDFRRNRATQPVAPLVRRMATGGIAVASARVRSGSAASALAGAHSRIGLPQDT